MKKKETGTFLERSFVKESFGLESDFKIQVIRNTNLILVGVGMANFR